MIPAIVQQSQVFSEKLNEVADTGEIKMTALTMLLLPP